MQCRACNLVPVQSKETQPSPGTACTDEWRAVWQRSEIQILETHRASVGGSVRMAYAGVRPWARDCHAV